MLADGRLPGGGYAHSGGVEAAIRAGRVRTAEELELFLRGRASTSGLVAAAFAARACEVAAAVDEEGESGGEEPAEFREMIDRLHREFGARTPSPASREVSVNLGRLFLRAMSAVHPHPLHTRLPAEMHFPVAYGVAAATLGVHPAHAGAGILHETVTGSAVAAVKLMRIDPFQAHRCIAAVLPLLDAISERAASFLGADPAGLPSAAAPLSDLFAEEHQRQEVRLFAS